MHSLEVSYFSLKVMYRGGGGWSSAVDHVLSTHRPWVQSSDPSKNYSSNKVTWCWFPLQKETRVSLWIWGYQE